MLPQDLKNALKFLFFVGLLFAAMSYIDYLRSPKLESLAQAQKMVSDLGGSYTNVPVIVFSTTWCGACRAAEQLLKKNSIPYVKADIERNPVANKLYMSMTNGMYSGIPLIVVGQTVIKGYDAYTILSEVNKLSKKSNAKSV